ncbi:MAG TPA: prolyl oligopeptidase family serine peptidase [Pyrinomonadaceae bacterium]|jgi:prolyl oligopeptidase|nr:prolyl oligopeptidase family serine peptidase [Pyrinomonadaceae bacterium]
MRKPVRALAALAMSALTVPGLSVTAGAQQKMEYPQTRTVEQADTYFGEKVADPYRWLEDENSKETADWVAAQNRLTFSYLERIPYRQQVRARLEKLFNYERYSAPLRRGDYYFYSHNTGLQNQNVYFVQKGLGGTPEVLIDPNKFSADGTTKLGGLGVSGDGRHVAYAISQGGSDWEEYRVMETATKKQLPDVLNWVKVSNIAWQGEGFYYSRYDAPAAGRAMTSKNENHRVYFHKVGTPQSEDVLVFEDRANPQRFHILSTTDDERFAVLIVSERGKGKRGNALFYRDAKSTDKTFKPVVADIGDDRFFVVDSVGDRLLVETDRNAPNGRVFLFDPKAPEEKNWKDVLPERPEPLDGVGSAGGKLFATYLKDVTSRVRVYSLDGKLENEIELPGLGNVGGFGGLRDDRVVFYTYSSFNAPPTIYRYDIASRKSAVFRAPQIPDFRPADYEVKQVFYTSKDGTRVPMFITHKKGLALDGRNPTLLYGYGGFNSTLSPSFSSLRLALLEQGFVYATANLRGGGEYGEKWHEAGTKLKKQNVFDDFIAAAEYLIREKYTSPDKLAIHGVSNGGLLVGAVANQRPELFKAVIQQAGVMDMLRFHKFTIGWNWVADYGSAENEAEYKALRAYSPIHNVRAGTKYPAVLITTADHDDRVVPAHSFKYAAAMQTAQAGDNPVLIRIDTKSGHGASSTTKAIEQAADIYSFLFYTLGVTPKY